MQARNWEFEKRSGHYGLLDHEGEILNDVNRAIYYSRYERVAAGLNSYWMNEPLRLGFAQDHSFNAEVAMLLFATDLPLDIKTTRA